MPYVNDVWVPDFPTPTAEKAKTVSVYVLGDGTTRAWPSDDGEMPNSLEGYAFIELDGRLSAIIERIPFVDISSMPIITNEPQVTYLGDVQRLKLEPGDIVVLKLKNRVSDEIRRRVHDVMVQRFPNHELLILENGTDIGVIAR